MFKIFNEVQSDVSIKENHKEIDEKHFIENVLR